MSEKFFLKILMLLVVALKTLVKLEESYFLKKIIKIDVFSR
jgi:hypothetical protein